MEKYLTAETYLTPEGVCEQVFPGMTVNHLAQLRFQGKGPRFLRPTPRKILYRLSDCIAWLEASERTSTTEDSE